MFGLAQVTGIMAGGLNVGRYYIKDEKVLLMFLMGLHLFIGVTFILLSIFPGAFVCFLLGILFMINYLFKYKEKDIPVVILIVYGIVCVILGMFTTNNYVLNALPATISLLTIANISFTEHRRIYRVLEIAGGVLWTIYSLLTGAFMVSISYIVIVVLVLRDIYRYDIVGNVEPTTELEIDLAKEEAEREKIKEENYKASKANLENGTNTGDVLLTSKLLNNYKTPKVSPSLRGMKIFGKRGHHQKESTYKSRYKRL